MHIVGLLAFSAAAFSSAFWPVLPAPLALACVAVLAIPLGAVAAQGNLCAVAILGVCAGAICASIWGFSALAHRLPANLDKTDYQVLGRITGLPSGDSQRLRFNLAVESLTPLHGAHPPPPLRQLQLSWYGPPALVPGQIWQLDVRLRSPRGLANPGGFDYAAWLLEQGVSATGYVRPSPHNRRVAEKTNANIDGWRFQLREHMRRLPLSSDARGFLAALSLGEQRDLSPAAWRALQTTGTLHLMVVSGQHIALVAGFGFIIGVAVGRLLVMAGLSLPARYPGIALAAVAAGLYAALSGASISTTRALIMLAVLLIAQLLRRRVTATTALLWALAAISATDPLAVLAAGFWLSFGAVAALLWYFSPRPQARTWWQFVPTQAVVFCALAGWLALFQGQIPLLSPIANLVAVPWISVLVLPLCLLGMLLLPFDHRLAEACWWLAGRQLEAFEQLNLWFAGISEHLMWQPQSSQRPLLVIALLAGGALLLAPRGLGVRVPGLVILAAVGLARDPARPPLAVTVLDVGQGLATVVETRSSVLVYDAGPAFSPRFDAGSAIVAPYLRYRGWRALDTLIVSHNDGDHSGGVAGVLDDYSPGRLLVGQPQALQTIAGGQSVESGIANIGAADKVRTETCVAGDRWHRDGVGFLVLHPPAGFQGSDNDHSCVLLIAFRDISVLIGGDIESPAEQILLNAGSVPRGISLLIAPHHGSQTSSSRAFVEAAAPLDVVYSAGYRHHFGHPHAAVVARYRAVGARSWNTADDGAIRFQWDDVGELAISAERQRRKHYWD